MEDETRLLCNGCGWEGDANEAEEKAAELKIKHNECCPKCKSIELFEFA